MAAIYTHTKVERLLEAVFSLRAVSKLYHESWLPLKSHLCGGGIEYLQRNPTSRKRRQKGNPVSNETVRYGLKFCGTWTRE
jgi:hypothetical protein